MALEMPSSNWRDHADHMIGHPLLRKASTSADILPMMGSASESTIDTASARIRGCQIYVKASQDGRFKVQASFLTRAVLFLRVVDE